jgi:hypothetical protein
MFAIIEGQYNEVTLKNDTRQISSITSDAPMNLFRDILFFIVVPCTLMSSKPFIYQLMHNTDASKEY